MKYTKNRQRVKLCNKDESMPFFSPKDVTYSFCHGSLWFLLNALNTIEEFCLFTFKIHNIGHNAYFATDKKEYKSPPNKSVGSENRVYSISISDTSRIPIFAMLKSDIK